MGVHYNPTVVLDSLLLNVDFGSQRSFSVNVQPTPTRIGLWASGTGASNATLDTDFTITDSPVNGVPLKMVQSGNDPYTNTYNAPVWNLAPAKAGETWTASVYVKASANTTVEGPVIFGSNNAGNYLTAAGFGTFGVNTNWKRISFTTTLTDANTTFVQSRLDGTTAGGSGVTVWWDGFQLEKGSSASAFSAFTNANNSAIYDLIDGSRKFTIHNPNYWSYQNGAITFDRTTQNLLLYSESFQNWTSVNLVVSDNISNNPLDGKQTASQLVTFTDNQNAYVTQNISNGLVSTRTYTCSVYCAGEPSPTGRGIVVRIRNTDGTSDARGFFELDSTPGLNSVANTGSTFSNVSGSMTYIGNVFSIAWYRVSVTFTTTTTVPDARVEIWNSRYGTSALGDGTLYLYGAQLEEFVTKPTKYNATTTSIPTKDGSGATLVASGDLAVNKFQYQNHTWEVWFKINEINPGFYGNNQFEGYSTLALYQGYHSGFIYTSSSLQYVIWNGISTSPVCASWTLGTSGSQINEGQWHQLVVVRSANTFTTYVNGAPLGTGSTQNGLSNTGIGTTNNLKLGKAFDVAANTGTYVYYSRNSIGNMKMYNRALSELEIEQNFAALRGRYGI